VVMMMMIMMMMMIIIIIIIIIIIEFIVPFRNIVVYESFPLLSISC
jgi:hypothetical protein